MGLGYEGYVKIGNTYVLGTGTGVPRARPILTSSSGYGGQIKTPVSEIGIGTPRTYDFEVHDGSVNFEASLPLLKTEILHRTNGWLYNRQTQKQILFSSRGGATAGQENIQQYDYAFWNSISLSADEGSAMEGSVGFVAVERTTYQYGELNPALVKVGSDLLCTQADIKPLNPLLAGVKNRIPVPFWNTWWDFDGTAPKFISWNLDMSQDVVKFFSCDLASATPIDPGPTYPKFLAVGPMTVSFSGTYMFIDPLTMGDSVTQAKLYVVESGSDILKLNDLELVSISDNVVSGNSTVPISVEYGVYGIA